MLANACHEKVLAIVVKLDKCHVANCSEEEEEVKKKKGRKGGFLSVSYC